METGNFIRSVREAQGLGRAEVAKRAGIPKDTLKKIELGKTGVSLPMLEKIAEALGLTLSELLQEAPPTDAPQTAFKNLPPVSEPTRSIKALVIPEPSHHEASPEYWILQGDRFAQDNHYQEALAAYERAEQLMVRKDYTWARFVLERLGDILIALNAFPLLEQKIALVETAYQQPFRESYGRDDQRIQMLIEEKRAWKDTWTGETGQAKVHGTYASLLAKQLGDEPRVEPTGLHLAGRAICEPVTTAILYHRLFPSLTVDMTARNRLQEAAHFLAGSQEVEKRTPSKAFTAQWNARALRGLGQVYDARQLDRYWRHLFAGDTLGAEARLDQVKLLLLEEEDFRETLPDAQDMLSAIAEPFQEWQYAPGLAEVAVTQAYVLFLGRQDRTPPERRQISDLCVAALCLHPFPKHPLFKVALRLVRLYIQAMSESEYQGYKEMLIARITQKEGCFALLGFVFSPQDGFIQGLPLLLSSARTRSP